MTKHELSALIPGAILCLGIAVVARFLGSHYGAPTMLFALLLGMSVHFLAASPRFASGIAFASKTLLRIGVALLGLRLTLSDVSGLGLTTILWVAAGTLVSIATGVLCCRAFRTDREFGLLTGGAVGICGASAALAISATLPQNKSVERDTIMTVVSVTALSTIAMILYPLIATWLGLGVRETGIFLGATIHDVAQVVGAGYSVSADTGDTATLVKLFRVALLVPIVLLIPFLVTQQSESRQTSGVNPPFPVFVIGFAVLVALNSLLVIPGLIRDSLISLSSLCLITAIAGLGVKTSLQSLFQFGFKPLGLILLETTVLALWILAGLFWVL
jgi:uncharacterized integral membrane protein (TIGR00698 family)